jgi:prefoldin subunit 5
LAALGAVSSNQLSIQFYKDQVTKLESENTELQAKIKKMLSDHQLVRDENSRHQFEVESLQ